MSNQMLKEVTKENKSNNTNIDYRVKGWYNNVLMVYPPAKHFAPKIKVGNRWIGSTKKIN
ncbi:hypothetical protein CKN73_01450 [Carnobacterium divergens]|nr:hypothetical protein CKN77_01445 [Carnobacterium divergens]TFJ52206.1 hypothetical protein CKN73_01450 [Carnobacterium divergens]TFJ57783.1 hypothetical protein CKN83_01445 [Carnobacterium divergens]TFJ65798.1 hypothetical protein CKN89_01450 [Carnobacterium divergens]TFJ74103.1 hypothetical protein CKN91_01445 [Carnobacterium divergens]